MLDTLITMQSSIPILFKNGEKFVFNDYRIYYDGGWNLFRLVRPKGVDEVRLRRCKVSKGKDGYCTVFMGGKNHLLSRVILSTYKTNEFREGLEVDHINQDPTDNRLENLRWVTRSENELNKRLTSKQKNMEHCREMSKKLQKAVDVFDLKGNFLKSFESAREASKELEVPYKVISAVCLGHRKSAFGYCFKFRGDKDGRNR